jgi:ectoine hydroxylase-related dioxygenase (phytanoyl-CoA dioxygenase family)
MSPSATHIVESEVAPTKQRLQTAEVQSFDAATVTAEEVVNALIQAGGCIVRNLLSADHVAQIEKDVRPHIEADRPWTADDIWPPETRRVMGLLDKSRTFVEAIPANTLYQTVSDKFLSDTIQAYLGDKLETETSKPQLNNTIIFSIGPGARDQVLHRDDPVHHNRSPGITADQYEFGRDTGLGLFVAGKKTTKANGATRFIPGSHLWDRLIPPKEDLTFYAEMDPGDAFFMLSSAFHGGSANTTEDEERLVYSCFMTKGYLRQVSDVFDDPCAVLICVFASRKRTNTLRFLSKQ